MYGTEVITQVTSLLVCYDYDGSWEAEIKSKSMGRSITYNITQDHLILWILNNVQDAIDKGERLPFFLLHGSLDLKSFVPTSTGATSSFAAVQREFFFMEVEDIWGFSSKTLAPAPTRSTEAKANHLKIFKYIYKHFYDADRVSCKVSSGEFVDAINKYRKDNIKGDPAPLPEPIELVTLLEQEE